jgi:putative DNA primase/helicase
MGKKESCAMNFVDFAAAHGLIVASLNYGKISRCKTIDKPHHKNGAYLFDDDFGWVQNHATMTEPAIWRPDGDAPKIDKAALAKRRAEDEARLRKSREDAAKKAKIIIGECVSTQHAYLDRKGFPELRGLVYCEDTDNLLVVPMYAEKRLVGCQMIDIEGGKKFLHGQQAKGAEFVIGRGDLHCWVEGYATGLSVHAVDRQRFTVHVCFSAGNLAHMAKTGIVIADNDQSKTGEGSALATGLPFYMPPDIGTDFNDLHKQIGTFKARLLLMDWLRGINRG